MDKQDRGAESSGHCANNITKSCQFDKEKVAKKPKEDNVRDTPGMTSQ